MAFIHQLGLWKKICIPGSAENSFIYLILLQGNCIGAQYIDCILTALLWLLFINLMRFQEDKEDPGGGGR